MSRFTLGEVYWFSRRHFNRPIRAKSLEFLKGRFLNRKRMGAFQQVYAIDRMTKGDYRSDFLADRRIEKFEAAGGSEHTGGLNLARKLERTSF